MTYAAHTYRYIRFDRYSFSCILIALLFAIAFMTSTSVNAIEIDDQKPQLTPSITGGELRNNQLIRLTVTDENPSVSHIRLWSKTSSSSALIHEVTSSAGDSELTYDWNTRLVVDGTYVIEYSAQDLSENSQVELYEVMVRNNQPLVTINDTHSNRDITGMVSRADVSFRILIDGQELTDTTPVVSADSDSSAMYMWTFKLPLQIADGNHILTVYATPIGDNGIESLSTVKPIDVETLVVTPLPNDNTPIVVGPVFPVLDLAPEINQFIAPVIKSTGDTVQTRLFGVSVDDLTERSSEQSVAKPSNGASTAILGVQDRNQSDQNTSAVAATPTGWSVFNVSWYWLLAVITMFGVLWWLVLHGINIKQKFKSSLN